MIEIIGSHALEEMARIGITENNIEIIVYTNDPGQIPHFHFFDRNKKKDNEGCIRIDKAEYFSHGGKNCRLNSSQRKELVEFLNDTVEDEDITNWRFLVLSWNRNNSNIRLDKGISMPDYTKLK